MITLYKKSNYIMNSKILLSCFMTLLLLATSCKKDDSFSGGDLTGFWVQQSVSVDGVTQPLNSCEAATSLLFETNGIYRMFDACMNTEHGGTWIVSDKNWLTMSLNKVMGKSADGTFRYGQIPIRFTILQASNDILTVRIKDTLGKRKVMVMFNQMEQDQKPATSEEAMELDTANKTMHTYIYTFKKTPLK